MILSWVSFFNVFILSNIFILYMWYSVKNSTTINKKWIGYGFLMSLLIIARMLVPIEFNFTKEIFSQNVFPMFFDIFHKQILIINNYTITFKDILFYIWITGSIVYFIRSRVIYISFKNKLDSLDQVEDENTRKILYKVCTEHDLSNIPRLVKTSMVSTPALIGFKNPTITVPSIDYDIDDWDYIFSHEIIHYKRGHLYIKLIVEIICGIYWWNPLIFLLRNTVNKLLEIDVDNIVTDDLSESEKLGYLNCLLRIVKSRSHTKDNRLLVTTGGHKSSFMVQRFQIVLNSHNKDTKATFKSIVSTFVPLLFSLILSISFIIEPFHIDPQDEKISFEIYEETSYLVEEPDGSYGFYVNNEYVGNVIDPNNIDVDLKIYKSLEEAINDRK